VHALLFYWAEDDLGVEDEVLDLNKVLGEIYQFSSVFARQIPSRGSQDYMEGYIRGLLDHCTDPNALIIVYYGGHGGLDSEGRFSWIAHT
jgi:hypothetical protein